MNHTFQPQKFCKFIDATKDILKSFRNEPRRSRIKLNNQQLVELEACFVECRHPSQYIKEELVKKLEIPLKNIQIWFQNRRAKEKTDRHDQLIKYEKRRMESIQFQYNQDRMDKYYNIMLRDSEYDSSGDIHQNKSIEQDDYIIRFKK